MGFSRSLFLRRTLYVASAVVSGSSAWSASADLPDRGAYLARITGCVGCHTPRTRDGDVVTSQLMSGGDHPIPSNLGAIVPPNITPDKETGLGDWRPEEIARAIRTGVTPGGRILSTAMPWRTQFKDLTDADALAIALYLKSLPPINKAVPPASSPASRKP
jgi:hypothetical protein